MFRRSTSEAPVHNPDNACSATLGKDAAAPTAPLWAEPLFTPGDRFPLGPSEGFATDRYDEPSSAGARPFSLRGLSAGAVIDEPASVAFGYDENYQVMTMRDGAGRDIRLGSHTRPGVTPGSTTGTTDGQPGQAPPEEVGAGDYQSD